MRETGYLGRWVKLFSRAATDQFFTRETVRGDDNDVINDVIFRRMTSCFDDVITSGVT